MKRSEKLRLIADLIDEGADFDIKSTSGIQSKMMGGLEELDYCGIEEPIRINDEERFLLKRFATKYKWIQRDSNGVIIVRQFERGLLKHLPNVFFDIFIFMDIDEQYVIEDLLNGKACKIYR